MPIRRRRRRLDIVLASTGRFSGGAPCPDATSPAVGTVALRFVVKVPTAGCLLFSVRDLWSMLPIGTPLAELPRIHGS